MNIRETLESERLIYERIDQINFWDIHQLFESEDESTFKYCSWSSHYCNKDTSDYMDRKKREWRTGNKFEYGIIDKRSRDLIGTCYIEPTSELEVFVFGIWLSADHQGNGYAQERAHMFISYLFDEVDASAIRVGCLEQNDKSFRSIAKYVKEHGGQYNGKIPVMNTTYSYDLDTGILMHHEFSITKEQYKSESTEITTPIDDSQMSDIGVDISKHGKE